MKHLLFALLLSIQLPRLAHGSTGEPRREKFCESKIQHKVKFANPADVLFPPFGKNDSKDDVFVIQEIAYGSRMFATQPQLIVRDKRGGLRLARSHSVIGAIKAEVLKERFSAPCSETSGDHFEALRKAGFIDEATKLLEKIKEANSLPADRTLCRPVPPTDVDLTDATIGFLRTKLRAMMAPTIMPPMQSYPMTPFGMPSPYGLPSPYGGYYQPPPAPPLKNPFQLIGQVIAKKGAGAEFQQVSFQQQIPPGPMKSVQIGEYVVRDSYGMVHSVKAQDLSPNSRAALAQSRFSCDEIKGPPARPEIRRVRPEDLLHDRPGYKI